MKPGERAIRMETSPYDLGATLCSGQTFRWRRIDGAWEGVIAGRWTRLRQVPGGIEAETAAPQADWEWLSHYLQTELDLEAVLATFPNDPVLAASVTAYRGLRLLRQEPWECLASFLLSSTKQIRQIEQVVEHICERYGEPVVVPPGHAPAYGFPRPERIAALSEDALRSCKAGFRAARVLSAARYVVEGRLPLDKLGGLTYEEAHAALITLPGVGPKIADCVLLFAYGFQDAFPVDVWVRRVLQEVYFPRRKVRAREVRAFVKDYFGPWAGYAQQYLFHYRRQQGRSGKVNPYTEGGPSTTSPADSVRQRSEPAEVTAQP